MIDNLREEILEIMRQFRRHEWDSLNHDPMAGNSRNVGVGWIGTERDLMELFDRYATRQADEARLEETITIRKQFHGHRFGISEFMNDRITELKARLDNPIEIGAEDE